MTPRFPNFVVRNLFLWAHDYIEKDPSNSINRNKHMNAFGVNIGDAIPTSQMPRNEPHDPKVKGTDCPYIRKDVARTVLYDLVSLVDFTGVENQLGQVFKRITETAQKNLEYLYDVGRVEKISKDMVDALIVDFINYAAAVCGMDYGMYTCDLRSPETK